MRRRFATSAAFVVALLAVAVAQQPRKEKIDPNSDKADPQPVKQKKGDPAEAAVAAALRNDTDVRIAQAKVQLAEAELAKAKQSVVLKVMTLKATIEDHRHAVAIATERYVFTERLVEKGQMEQRALVEERAKVEMAKAALARTETELKLITGDAGATGGKTTLLDFTDPDTEAVQRGLRWLTAQQLAERTDYAARINLAHLAWRDAIAVKGPVPDRIRAALDKTVPLGKKGEKVTFEQALEVFKKEAGLDVPVRMNLAPQLASPEITSQGEELPVVAWLQLYMDVSGGAVLIVREYGLMFTHKSAAPPDAPTLTEFWKQKPPAADKKESVPEPKSKSK